MTVVQNSVTLSEKRRPGTGSSPKTAGSQSVKVLLCIDNYSYVLSIALYEFRQVVNVPGLPYEISLVVV